MGEGTSVSWAPALVAFAAYVGVTTLVLVGTQFWLNVPFLQLQILFIVVGIVIGIGARRLLQSRVVTRIHGERQAIAFLLSSGKSESLELELVVGYEMKRVGLLGSFWRLRIETRLSEQPAVFGRRKRVGYLVPIALVPVARKLLPGDTSSKPLPHLG
jgi:hypothetical protein